jgi:hypothetical protein
VTVPVGSGWVVAAVGSGRAMEGSSGIGAALGDSYGGEVGSGRGGSPHALSRAAAAIARGTTVVRGDTPTCYVPLVPM